MLRIAFVTAAAALWLAMPSSAQAQAPTCVKRTELIKHLANKFHETPAAVGVADNGTLLEVFVSTTNETWTVAVTLPNGLACMLATGQQWQDLPRVATLDEPT